MFVCGGQRFAGLWIQRVPGTVLVKLYACRAAYGVFVYGVGDNYTISVFRDVYATRREMYVWYGQLGVVLQV